MPGNVFELPQSEYYDTIIGYSEVYKRKVYQIINKHTGVIEFENPMFGTIKAVFKVIDAAEDEDDPTFSEDIDPMDFSGGRTIN